MEAKLSFRYDRDADILHIDKCVPYASQESEELGDDLIAPLNPTSGEIENLEVLFFRPGCFVMICSSFRRRPTCAARSKAEQRRPSVDA